MAPIRYLDLDLGIEKTAMGYRARVLASPAGQAACDFTVPFSELELENFILKMGGARRAMRRADSPEMQAAKAFGSKLFAAVFAGDVRGALTSSVYAAEREQAGLRVRMHLAGVPELAGLPWEFLYNSSVNRFLAMSNKTPLVRYLELPEPIRPLSIRPPLNILVMISSPTDFPKLNVEDEFDKLKQALAEPERAGRVVLERLERASLGTLQRHLRQGDHHIFHFVGHGGFDPQTQDGLLILEDADGRGRRVTAQHLGTLLHDHDPLRLVLLNACEGARAALADPFAGTAQTLIQQGIPAVIAMQFEISDEAAIGFTQEFYGSLAVGYPVDAAVGEARKRIFNDGNEMEWGTPVLYMRSPDGKVFDVQPIPDIPAPPPKPVETAPAPRVVSPTPEPVNTHPVAEVLPAKQDTRPVAQAAPPPGGKRSAEPATRSRGGGGLRWFLVGGGIIALLLGGAIGGWGLFGSFLNPTPAPAPTQQIAAVTNPTPAGPSVADSQTAAAVNAQQTQTALSATQTQSATNAQSTRAAGDAQRTQAAADAQRTQAAADVQRTLAANDARSTQVAIDAQRVQATASAQQTASAFDAQQRAQQTVAARQTVAALPTPTPLPNVLAPKRYPNLCLGIQNNSSSDGASVEQRTCSNAANQLWTFQDMGGGYYQLIVQSTGKCMSVENGSPVEWARVVQQTCQGKDYQLWSLKSFSGYVQLVAKHSSQCIDEESYSGRQGLEMHQGSCKASDNDNQLWQRK